MPRVRDILIVPTDDRYRDHPDWETHPPASWEGETVDLGDGITIERLEHEDSERVMDASAPAGLNFDPVRQFGHLYAFVHVVDEVSYAQRPFAWDADVALNETIGLSRLVLDNAYCSEFAARVVEDDARTMIVPISGLDQRLAYRLRETRFWLTTAEAGELAGLRAAYRASADDLPPRVRRALRRAERSCHTRFLDEAVTQIATGLEALLKTERHRATQQFTTRVPALAAELGLDAGAVDWAAVYDARSAASHGSPVELFAPAGHTPGGAPPTAAVAFIAGAQDVLRAAVRRAIEDVEFRGHFADDAAVSDRWPL